MFGNALEAWLKPGQSGKLVSKGFHILTHRQLHQVCGCTCQKIHCQIRCRFLVQNVAQVLQSLIPIQPCKPLAVLLNFNDSQSQVSPILKSSFDNDKIWLISRNPGCLPGLDSITSVFCERPHTSSIVQDPSFPYLYIYDEKLCEQYHFFLNRARLCVYRLEHLHSSSDIINKWLIIMHTLAFPFWLYFYFYFMCSFVFTDLHTFVLLFK